MTSMYQDTQQTPPIPEPAVNNQMTVSAEPQKAYTITIVQLDHGYHVSVGCKSFAIETKEKLIEKINAYLSDVPKVTADYFDKTFTI